MSIVTTNSAEDGWHEGYAGTLPVFGGRQGVRPAFAHPGYGARLFTAVLDYDLTGGRAWTFLACHCMDGAEILERMSWRVPRIRMPLVVVTAGIDLANPVVRRLVPVTIARTLSETGDLGPTNQLSAGADLCIHEHAR